MIPYNAENDFWLAQDWVVRIMDKLWNRNDDVKARQMLLASVTVLDPEFVPPPRDFDVINDKHLETETVSHEQ